MLREVCCKGLGAIIGFSKWFKSNLCVVKLVSGKSYQLRIMWSMTQTYI